MAKEVAKKEKAELATTQKRGLEEGTSREELIFPRAKLMQALSPELEENGDLKAGLIINSITRDTLPEIFIPVFKFTTWIRFNPRDTDKPGYDANFEPGDVIWRSNDPNDPKVIEESKFGENGERPIATRFLNFFSIFEGGEMPVVISFANTSYKTGKQLLSLCKFTSGDIFSRKYKLGAKKVSNDKGTYYVYTIGVAGKVTDSEYAIAEKMWQDFHAAELRVHEEEKPEETEKAPF